MLLHSAIFSKIIVSQQNGDVNIFFVCSRICHGIAFYMFLLLNDIKFMLYDKIKLIFCTDIYKILKNDVIFQNILGVIDIHKVINILLTLLAVTAIVVAAVNKWDKVFDTSAHDVNVGETVSQPDEEQKAEQKEEDKNVQVVSASVRYEPELLNDLQAEVLRNYANAYIYSLVNLESRDISGFYADTESEGYYINKTAIDVITAIRKMSHKDLTLEGAAIIYNVQDTYIKNGRLVVEILEDNTQKFRFMEEESKNFIIRHTFELTENDGNWYIHSHRQEEDFYLLTEEAWEKYSGTPQEISVKTFDFIIADAQENLEWRKEHYTDKTYPKTASDKSYNRDAAVEYAENWVGRRNYTENYLAYDDYGGNCQNFASQCLFAGGLAMDFSGTSTCHWKFYSQTLNEYSRPSGRSYSWTGVEPFYDYCYYNTGIGIIAEVEWGTAYTEKGDVIQVGAMGRWRHSLLVTDVEYDENGYATEIIVASNTADRINYPLSAYIYTAPRLIHIVGQNI